MRKWTSAAFLVGLAVVALGAWQGRRRARPSTRETCGSMVPAG